MATRKRARKRQVWRRLGSKVDYRNPWFRVIKDRVVRPDGRPGVYHVVQTRGDAVFIAALDASGRVLLVRLHRYPTRSWSLEVPGGNSEGQPPLSAAKREFLEETGYLARRWTRLGSWQTVNGLSDETSRAYLAQGLTYAGGHRREEEGISGIRWVPLARALEMSRTGRITDGQSILTLYLAAARTGIIRAVRDAALQRGSK